MWKKTRVMRFVWKLVVKIEKNVFRCQQKQLLQRSFQGFSLSSNRIFNDFKTCVSAVKDDCKTKMQNDAFFEGMESYYHYLCSSTRSYEGKILPELGRCVQATWRARFLCMNRAFIWHWRRGGVGLNHWVNYIGTYQSKSCFDLVVTLLIILCFQTTHQPRNANKKWRRRTRWKLVMPKRKIFNFSPERTPHKRAGKGPSLAPRCVLITTWTISPHCSANVNNIVRTSWPLCWFSVLLFCCAPSWNWSSFCPVGARKEKIRAEKSEEGNCPQNTLQIAMPDTEENTQFDCPKGAKIYCLKPLGCCIFALQKFPV